MAMDFPSSPTDGQASNGYTWSAAKGAWVGGPGTRYTQAEADAKFVDVAGDTMTGHLFLPTGPAAANAIRKDYVDTADALKADKSYVDSQDATKLALAGGTTTGMIALKPTVGGIAQAGANLGSLEVGGNTASDAAFLTFHRHGAYAVYFGLDTDNNLAWGGWSAGAARNIIYHTGNFNPASYAPVGGVPGGFTIGSSTHGTDGNIYMPWAADWLSNVLAGKLALTGGTVSGLTYFSSILWAVGSAANTTTNAVNVYINPAGNMHRSTSSADFKTALEPLEATFADKVLELETVFYRPTADTIDRTDWSRYGFIAENCYTVDPRFASCTEEDEKPIIHDINAIVAALLDVVRRQNDRIAALEAGP